MTQIIATLRPISKQMQDGKALYGVELTTSEEKITKQVWKTLYQLLKQRQISEIAFDFDRILGKELQNVSTDEEKLKLISKFMSQCKSRYDIANLVVFRKFCNLTQCDFEYLVEWKRVNMKFQDMVVVDFAWDSQEDVLISLHKPNSNKLQKIRTFFKQLLSKQSHFGAVRVHKCNESWKLLHETFLEAEPSGLEWNSRGKLLFVSTDIGIYTYTLTFQGQTIKQQLIDFVKMFDIRDFQYSSTAGIIFCLTPQQLLFHSINYEHTVEVNSHPFNQSSSLALNKSQTRLYLSQQSCLRIFDVSNYKNIKEIAIIKDLTGFNRLVIYGEKYLFGVSNNGYVSVFQIKSAGKEYLTNVLTSIDCPQNPQFFAFNERAQMIITSNGKYIVLVSSKNVPLFAGGSHNSPITAGLFHSEANLIMTADQESNIIFYNLSMRTTE